MNYIEILGLYLGVFAILFFLIGKYRDREKK